MDNPISPEYLNMHKNTVPNHIQYNMCFAKISNYSSMFVNHQTPTQWDTGMMNMWEIFANRKWARWNPLVSTLHLTIVVLTCIDVSKSYGLMLLYLIFFMRGINICNPSKIFPEWKVWNAFSSTLFHKLLPWVILFPV